jgi:hypothetical protein
VREEGEGLADLGFRGRGDAMLFGKFGEAGFGGSGNCGYCSGGAFAGRLVDSVAEICREREMGVPYRVWRADGLGRTGMANSWW